MAYKFETEHLKLSKEDDKRVKLNDEEKKEIKKLYDTGMFSQRKLAKMYGVSRRSIQFIIDPEKLKENHKKFSERQKDGRYYNKERHREYIKKYRERKKQLYNEGKLV